jgi:cell wall-associated NlpC family hydrolase
MTLAADLIGKPWRAGAAGPDDFDCWNLVRFISLHDHGRELPPIAPADYGVLACARAVARTSEHANWFDVPSPAPGDVGLMAHARHPSHCGIWIPDDGGKVLHCVEGAGVVSHRLDQLRSTGWGRVTWYRHK